VCDGECSEMRWDNSFIYNIYICIGRRGVRQQRRRRGDGWDGN